jgi:hypothetical protein
VLQDSKFIPSNCTPLPVEFLFLHAYRQNPGNLLQWSASEDSERSAYHIERSTEASGGFKEIGSVEAANGNYSFLDVQLGNAPGYYYRVYKMNEERQLVYSKTVYVDRGDGYFSIGPNPFQTETKFHGGSAQYSIHVVNLLGQTIDHFEVEKNQIQTIGQNWCKGVYIMEIRDSNGQMKFNKLIKE